MTAWPVDYRSAPPAPTGNGLEVLRVSRTFGGLSALSEFSLQVCPGDLVGLIGPNGAGKTTAFNVITGVYAPSAGQIYMDGRRIDGLSPVRVNHAGLARTFQSTRLFTELTVLDNVVVGFNRSAEHGLLGTILRAPRFQAEGRHMQQRGLELLRTFGLHDRADMQARNLPYGDQRRLEIARALATGPKVLLLDEPAAGMNPREKQDLMNLIRFIRDNFGLGIFLIEHDMKLVMSICRRIAVLDHGETIATGTPEQVRNDPRVVEAYLGEPE
jgi:branched-chain amino acid transport system ATP-binding protein